MDRKKILKKPFEASEVIPFHTTMRDMTRAFATNPYKFPKITVENTSSEAAGSTFAEKVTSKTESGPELEVLKAILNREGYLARLQNIVRTINKKFKIEIAEMLDLIRAASLDVVETILIWREIKRDHDAAFMWNGQNYLLKMVSDLDYLTDYRAIKKWIGFSLNRNPFCIPDPMEVGVSSVAAHIFSVLEHGNPQPHGYSTIGGMQPSGLKKYYGSTPVVAQATTLLESATFGNGTNFTSTPGKLQNGNLATTRLLEPAINSLSNGDNGHPETASIELQLDHDMSLIRQSEIVILKEEEKFGRHCRDLKGRVVPILQALTERTEMELTKDDHRPLLEKALTLTHAPHALNSDIGIAEEPWIPGPVWSSVFNKLDAITRHMDDSLQARNRGQTKIGGHLAPLVTKCAESRERRPLIPSITSKMEFLKFRKSNECQQRLVEIGKLREQILLENSMGVNYELSSSTTTSISKKKSSKRNSSLSSRRDKSKKSNKSGVVPVDTSIKNDSQLFGGDFDDALSARSTDTESVTDSMMSTTEGTRDAASLAMEEKHRKAKNDLKILAAEEKFTIDLLTWLQKKDSMISKLKIQERAQKSAEKSREIERKRRLLTEQQGRRKGPPPLEPSNIYDYFAAIIQTCIRGFVARRYTRRYREASVRAAAAIQARARGYICRNRRYYLNRKAAAALTIQKNFRGWKSRGTSAAMAKESGTTRATILIQRMWRGVLGRRRCIGKRALDAAAQNIRGCVDPQELTGIDIKDLATRIQYAIEEPLTTKYPPVEVLELIKLVTLVMQGSRGMLGLVEYSFINTRSYQEVDAEFMSWDLAAKLLHRSERYIRMIRTMAYAPSSKPPRIISVPNNVQLLYAAQLQNPNWNEDTFKNMGIGSKVCVNLFKWLSSMVEIAIRQQEFLSFLGSSFPDWLPKYTEYQRVLRHCQFRAALDGRALTILKEKRDILADTDIVKPVITKEINSIRKELGKIKEEMLEILKQQTALRADQGKREEYALTAMEVKTHDMMRDLRAVSVKYQDTLRKAQNGEKRAIAEVDGLKSKVVLAQLNITEFDAQLKMLQVQCSQNEARRKDDRHLLPEIRLEAVTAGEAKGYMIYASSAVKAFMSHESAVYPEDLEPLKYRQYKLLKAEEDRCWDEYRKQFVSADSRRVKFEEEALDALHELEQQEHQSKNKIQPSESDLREERLEDDLEAQQNRMKQRQYVPDFVLKPPKHRTKPALVCLSRDLPAYCKLKIIDEITRNMPDLFAYIDSDLDMGLDLIKMQEILSNKKSIICCVDPGLTRISRTSFLKQLELMVMSLVPCPTAVVAIGDDTNKRLAVGDAHFGVAKRDLTLMKDGDIKICLEGMAWAIHELQQPIIQQTLQSYCALVKPPSIEFLLVAEALLVLQSTEDRFQGPDSVFLAQSWHIVQQFISRPSILVESLRIIRRGKHSPKRVEVICCYLNHSLWPVHGSTVRQGNAPMHIMAYFIEQWALCEGLTRERGGIPLLPLTKGAFGHLECVVTVSDIGIHDPEDLLISSQEHSIGWRMASAQLIAGAAAELMVYKAGRRINGIMHVVRVYREESMVYLEAYDPNTSQQYLATVKVKDIPKLMMPSSNPNAKKNYAYPPQTPYELYKRMAELLDIKKVYFKPNSRKMLSMHREIVFMQKLITKINGHLVELKCYELVLGEMVIKAVVPEFSAFLECVITEEIRLKIYENGDPLHEREIAGSVDGPGLLPFVLDRLQLFPERCMVSAWGGSMFSSYERKHSLNEQQRTQGLVLSVNCHHSLGKRIYRNICYLSGILHLLVLKSSSLTKLLKIVVYEPTQQLKLELEIDLFIRKLVTGCDNDAAKRWISKLQSRLHLGYHGKRCLRLDLAMYKGMHKFLSKIWQIQVEAVDALKLRVVISDPESCTQWANCLSLEQAINIINYFRLNQDRKCDMVLKQRAKAIKDAQKAAEKEAAKIAAKAAKDAAAAAKVAKKKTKSKDKDNDGESSPAKTKKGKGKSNNSNNNDARYEIPDGIPDALTIDSLLPTAVSVEPFERTPYLVADNSIFDVLESGVMTMDKILLNPKYLKDLAHGLELILEEERVLADETRLRGIVPITEDDISFDQDKEYSNYKVNSSFVSGKQLQLSSRLVFGHKVGLTALESLREGLKSSNANSTLPVARESKGDWDASKRRKQPPLSVSMENELEALAKCKREEYVDYNEVSNAMHQYFMELPDAKERNRSIKIACIGTMSSMLDMLEERDSLRQMERQNPGFIKELRRRADKKLAKKMEKASHQVSDYDIERKQLEEARSKEIVTNGEKQVYKAAARATFRDKKSRWHDQVIVTVYESMCWFAETGPGRRLRFSVYDLKSEKTYEGLIRNSKELADILGPNGTDLLDKKKISEMVPFVVKFRMFVGKILYDEQGNLLDHLAPVNYRVEFDALPPAETDENGNVVIDLGEEAAEQQREKLKESEISRGKKLLRLTRRVTSMLLHLSFYEVAAEQDSSVKSSKRNSRRNSLANHSANNGKRKNSVRRRSSVGGGSRQGNSEDGQDGTGAGGRRASVMTANRRQSVTILDTVPENGANPIPRMTSGLSSGINDSEDNRDAPLGDNPSDKNAPSEKNFNYGSQPPPPPPPPPLPVPESARSGSIASSVADVGPSKPPLNRAVSALTAVSTNNSISSQPGPATARSAGGNDEQSVIDGATLAEKDDGFGAKKMITRQPIYDAPTIRVLAFEPNTKVKVNTIISAKAVMEIVGGVYSPYLEPDNRRELARIVADGLFLTFPRDAPFEMHMKGTATMLETANMVASMRDKNGWLTEGIKIQRVPGTVFRSTMRVNGMELFVTMYHDIDYPVGTKVTPSAVPPDMPLRIQFLSSACFDRPVEMELSSEEQTQRIESRLVDTPEGAIRNAAARRLIKYFKAHLEEDENDPLKKFLRVSMLEPQFGFWNDFLDVAVPNVADARPVGLPEVFMPLDRCGFLINRRGMLICNRNKKAAVPKKDYLVSVYTKTETDYPDAGVIIKLYEQDTEEAIVLHVGGANVKQMCADAGAFTLLDDIKHSIEQSGEQKLDAMETELISLTDKGDLVTKYMKLMRKLCDIILEFISVYTDANAKTIPCLTSLSRGILPA